jgi:hypothetical protein
MLNLKRVTMKQSLKTGPWAGIQRISSSGRRSVQSKQIGSRIASFFAGLRYDASDKHKILHGKKTMNDTTKLNTKRSGKVFGWLFLMSFFLGSSAWAHIPKMNTILTKVAANSGGTNGLIIKRTVTLKEDNVTAEELWHIANADLMKVDVSGTNSDGSKYSFDILYKDGKRVTSTTSGGLKSFQLSGEFYEPLLHYRSMRALLSKLISMQLVPTWAGSPAQENFITLDRLKGSLVYVLGAGEAKNTQAPPQLWIEQDSFVIRKVRLGSQIEVEFDNIKNYGKEDEKGRPAQPKIYQPDLQTIYWKNTTVLVQNTSVQLVPVAKITPLFKMEKAGVAQLPENVNLKEFYSRFR